MSERRFLEIRGPALCPLRIEQPMYAIEGEDDSHADELARNKFPFDPVTRTYYSKLTYICQSGRIDCMDPMNFPEGCPLQTGKQIVTSTIELMEALGELKEKYGNHYDSKTPNKN